MKKKDPNSKYSFSWGLLIFIGLIVIAMVVLFIIISRL